MILIIKLNTQKVKVRYHLFFNKYFIPVFVIPLNKITFSVFCKNGNPINTGNSFF